MTNVTPEQRAELREAAFKCEGGLSAWYRRRILDVLDALDEAERLVKAGVVEFKATGMHEGVNFGPEWSTELLHEYIETHGGQEAWEQIAFE
jgi:hypothetical protein